MKISFISKSVVLSGFLLSSCVIAQVAKSQEVDIQPVPQVLADKSWMDVFDRVKKSVVQIITYAQPYNFSKPFEKGDFHMSGGSGFIATAQGDIYTNWHVINEATRIFVQHPLIWKEQFEAEFVGGSPEYDWAHIRIKPAELERLNILLPSGAMEVLAFGDSDSIRVGSEIAVVGYPLGDEEIKYSIGAISGHSTTMSYFGECLTTSALALPGNSGGPCIDKKGNVIGVLVGVHGDFLGEKIKHIIPISRLKTIKNNLENGRILKEVFWGIETFTATAALYSSLGCPANVGGVHICNVYKHSLGQKAGLMKDDILVAINDFPVDRFGFCKVPWTDYRVNYMDVLMRIPYGSSVTFTVYRNGQKNTCSIVKEEEATEAVRACYLPFEQEPKYDVFGGFVVMEMTRNHAVNIFENALHALFDGDVKQLKNIISGGLLKFCSGKKISKSALVISYVFPESCLAKELARSFTPEKLVLIKKVNDVPVLTIDELHQAALKSLQTGILLIEADNGARYALFVKDIIQQEQDLIEKYHYPLSPLAQAFIQSQTTPVAG